MATKRINIFSGHYGSGKTNIAINFAKMLKKEYNEVALADLDIVNPYFRALDSKEELERAGVKVISLPFANTNVDLPAIPASAITLFKQKTEAAVVDVGGDERGSLVLGRFAPDIKSEDYDMFFVVNFCRPLTATAQEAYGVMQEIEAACSLKFTAIINNTNIGDETSRAVVQSGIQKAKELEKLSQRPIRYNTTAFCEANEKPLKINLQNKPF